MKIDFKNIVLGIIIGILINATTISVETKTSLALRIFVLIKLNIFHHILYTQDYLP